jgi:cytochrome b subunit of formate dehydrogenase
VILVVTSLHLGASTEGADKLSEEDTRVVTEHTGVPALKRQRQGAWLVSLTTFLFILLQSACTAVMAVSGLRLLIGLGSLAAASFIPGFIFFIHTDKIRIPMMVIAVFGSVLNLYVVWRIRSLRARPASQWRVQPVAAKQRRSETIQIVLSILTLLLVVAEILAHYVLLGAFL